LPLYVKSFLLSPFDNFKKLSAVLGTFLEKSSKTTLSFLFPSAPGSPISSSNQTYALFLSKKGKTSNSVAFLGASFSL